MGVIDNWYDVTWSYRLAVLRGGKEGLLGNICEFRDPFTNVELLWDRSALSLRPGVLDPEVGRGVRAGAGAPLPAAVVRRRFPHRRDAA